MTPTAKWLDLTGLLLVAVLFLVWPIPHTVAARGLLLFCALLLYGYLFWHRRPAQPLRGVGLPLAFYGVLTAWIVVVALFLSPETGWSLGEIRKQWLAGLASLVAGGLLGAGCATDRLRIRLFLVLYAALMTHVVVIDVMAISRLLMATPDLQALHMEVGLRVQGWTEGPDKANYLTNLLLTLLLAEVFVRAAWHRRFLPLPAPLIAVSVAAGLFAVYATAMRNGGIELVMLVLVATALFFWQGRARIPRRALAGALVAALALSAVLAYGNYQSDRRWLSFIDTIPIALDTQTHRAWLDPANHPLPKLPDGETVQHSNYTRIAWFKEGVVAVSEHPLGIGFGRNAFGHALRAKYGMGAGHSHFGLLDLAIGAGIPGALLWVAFLASLMRLALQRMDSARDFTAVWLMFVVTGYSMRMLIDSVIRDHMLQQFLFLVGALAVMAVARPRPDEV